MGKFNRGNFVKGNEQSCKYVTTTQDMTCGLVLAVKDERIKVKILSHNKNHFGKFWVDAECFDEAEKPINFNEIVLSQSQIDEILTKHKIWLETRFINDIYGERANLEDANLEGANLIGANLEDANLIGANLEDANLEGANLIGANLEDANLEDANLEDANLMGANLEGANLIGANLEDANLMGANLMGANLMGANLKRANLKRANLEGANLIGANLEDANTEYKVGGTYTYTGYAKGCGADADAESSLECDVNSLETITLDTRSTYWRNDTYAEKGGIQTRDEVVSVYFSVDDEVVSEYGKLQKIHASWLELNSAPILVTDNEFFYNEMMKYAGVSIPTVDNTVPLKVFTNMNIMPGGNNYNSSSYSFSWNIELENRPDLGYSVISKRPVAQIPFVFKSNNFVDRENLNRYVYEYNKSFNRGTISTKTNPVSADLFVNSGVAKEVNIDSNEKFDLIDSEAEVYTMHGFDGWISSLFNPNKYPGYRNIKMIEEIPKGISFSEGIAKKYFIDSEAVSDFKQYCFTEELKQKTVFLFRYRISDYVTYPKAGYTINYKHTKDVGYMAEMGVDLDFDIIDLTFNKDGVFAVIPVVMSPIDIINPITPPIEGKDWFSALIAIIVAVIVLIVLAPVLPYILKAVVWVVTLPFRAIGGIVKTFKKDKRG